MPRQIERQDLDGQVASLPSEIQGGADGEGDTYAIKDTKTNQFVIEGGWSRKKDAEEFLVVSLMLGKLKD